MGGGDKPTIPNKQEDNKMTDRVKEVLRDVLVRNLAMYIDEADKLAMSPEEVQSLDGIMNRIADDTATEADWIEAIEQLDAAE